MSARTTSIVAWLLCAAVIAAVVFKLVTAVFASELPSEPFSLGTALVVSLLPISFALVGTLILSNHSGNAIGWLLILPAFAFAVDIVTAPIIGSVIIPPESLSLRLYLALYVDGVSWVFFIFPLFLIALLFPTGKPLSPRWRWVIGLVIGALLFFLVVAAFVADVGPGEDGASWTIQNPIGFITPAMLEVIFGLPWGIVLGTLTLLSLASIFLRYRRAGAVERQQLKWLLFAFGLFAAAYLPAVLTAGDLEDFGRNILQLLFLFATLAFPIAIGIAILRYRLWDIDVIIRRTVTYAIVTASLLVVFFGSVIALQLVFAGIFPDLAKSEIVTVLSTLAIAALFVPLRNRIQNEIDKRFNRKKYDAQQVLQKFGETVRDETNLEKLTNELVNVVQETMQPKSVSVWLKKERGGKQIGN